MPTRRQFIRTGIFGSALLAAVWVLQRPLDRLGKSALVEQAPLPVALPEVIAAIAPVILAGVFPAAGAEREAAQRRITRDVAAAVAALGAAAQREVAELFALLAFAPTRIAVAGVRSPWAQAGETEVRSFLDGWRSSSLMLLQSGYLALHDLVLGAWYADPQTWARIAYPGPPTVPHS